MPATIRAVGFEILSPTTTLIVALDIPKGISRILIQPQGANIRWCDRADFPLSTTVGQIITDGQTFEYDGDFKNFRCIAVSGTPSVVIYKYCD